MAPSIVSRRDLSRATLARQMLLDRRQIAPLKAIEMLAGLQAQVPRAPFISLWSRLAGFKREDLSRLIHTRKAIRATMMRGTSHLMGRKDFIAFRNLIQPVLTQVAHAGGQMKGIDIEARLEEGQRILEKAPRTFDAFRKALRETSPGVDDAAVARAVQFFLPLIRIPDDSPWSFKANAAFFPADAWLKQPLGPDATVGELMLRYLAAFGPQRWRMPRCGRACGLSDRSSRNCGRHLPSFAMSGAGSFSTSGGCRGLRRTRRRRFASFPTTTISSLPMPTAAG